ncbi:MAG: DinB family protein [Rhizobacter sp.]|nr:DinB family protein [Ferruginibacter sp.]
MKENQRLKKLLDDHFSGDPWIDVPLLKSLDGITAKDAARSIHGLNSIWQIVHHMTCWRETILERVKGKKIPSPADNYFALIEDLSSKAWVNAIKRLKESQKDLQHYLSVEFTDPDVSPEGSSYTRYELLQGILQHDAYHLGQVILIRKMLAG